MNFDCMNPEALEVWKHWIIERNRVYIHKEVEQQPYPWTEDSILREYKFTNVKRWQDRESRWLIENVCNNSSLTYEDKIYNCILFRTWNKSSTFEIICGKGISTFDLRDTPLEEFEHRVNEYAKYHPKYVWFTNAFLTGGLKRTWKWEEGHFSWAKERAKAPCIENIPIRMIYLVRSAIDAYVYERIQEASSPEEVYAIIRSVSGCAEFLAYQIYVDLTYIDDFPFTEDEFVIPGGGCINGMNILFDLEKNLPVSYYTEKLYWLRDHQEEIFGEGVLDKEFSYLPKEKRALTVMDLENSFCEFSKYWRVLKQLGRPKNKYHPENSKKHALF